MLADRIGRLLGATTLAAVAASVVVGGAAPAAAQARPIHPGDTVTMSGVTCEVGFILKHKKVRYVAVPASCAGTDDGAPTNGCEEAQVPYGSRAHIQGALHTARLVYSSFTTMQARGSTAANRCASNDMVLLRLNKHDWKRVSPGVPGSSGPTATTHHPPAQHSSLSVLLQTTASAIAMATSDNGWQHALAVEAAVQKANVGAPVMTPQGHAVGMLSAIPGTGPFGTSAAFDLHRELQFLHTVHGFHHVTLMHSH